MSFVLFNGSIVSYVSMFEWALLAVSKFGGWVVE